MNAIASLSVLLATRDRAPSLKITLESLRRVTLPENVEVELVVVDNASTDGTKAEVEAFIASAPPLAVRYLYCARGGKSAALNLGLAEIGSDLVVFTDDDMSFDGNWLVAFVEHFREHQCAGARGKVLLAFEASEPAWMTPKAAVLLGATPVELEEGEVLTGMGGGNMVARLEASRATGPFREDLGPEARRTGYSEDTEWSQRLAQQGPLLFCPSAVNYHRIPPSRARRGYVLRRQFEVVAVEWALRLERGRFSSRWFEIGRELKGLLGALLRPKRRFEGIDLGLELAARAGRIWGLLKN